MVALALRAGAGAAVISVVAIAALGGCSGAPPPHRSTATQTAAGTATPTPYPFTANGTISSPVDEARTEALSGGHAAVGGPCVAPAGYSDIREGAQVVITNATDTKIAVGTLGPGVSQQGSTNQVADGHCVFTFQVENVPGFSKLYSVHIGNTFRGEQTYSKQELYSGIQMSIG